MWFVNKLLYVILSLVLSFRSLSLHDHILLDIVRDFDQFNAFTFISIFMNVLLRFNLR